MAKSGLQLLVGIALAAMVFGACMGPFEGYESSAEYDAQGRRLVTLTVDLDSAARAVNTPLAKAYIDFYEVVFEGPEPVTEYYSATTTKGAGKRLSLRVPVGNYKGYLNAGYLEDNGDAVLLAQASDAGAFKPAASTWNFTLVALNLQVNSPTSAASPGVTGTSTVGDPIYVTIAGDTTTDIQMTSGGIPYYAPGTGDAVAVTVTTGVANVVDYSAGNVVVTPLIRKTDTPPVIIDITSQDFTSGVLTFGFDAPTTGNGISNIGFDVTVASVAATRNNGVEPVRWHIRNGLTVDAYDNGVDDATNTGAGLVFAFGSALPETTDTYGISFAPPSGP
jgi:hypothetical protein